MKVVITGGAGLVGSHIADLLVKKNIQKIIIIDDFSRGVLSNLSYAKKNGNIEIIKGSILDFDLLLKCFDKADFIFHQAAIRITQCAKSNRLAHDVMSTGTFNVAEVAVKCQVKKLLLHRLRQFMGRLNLFLQKKFITHILMTHCMVQQKHILKRYFEVSRICMTLIMLF